MGGNTATNTSAFVPFFVPPPDPNPSYLQVYPIEANFEFDKWRGWMGQNWAISLYASLFYLCLIFSGRRWMRHRKPYNLRLPLLIWNFVLASFSIYGFTRVFPEIRYLWGIKNGVHTSICFRDAHNMATVFWGWWCTLSKMVELGDTFFIVLRKQPLIFLHWYHHITVMVYCWFTYEEYDPALKLFMGMNFFVHGIMYTYYALRAAGIKVPRGFAMVITTLQIAQMIAGVAINIHSLRVKLNGGECYRQTRDISIALAMYFTYFLLFANFFINVYLARSKQKSS
ncbi:unnamed protein product [Orchesella dallaii]|uniref:Elongation of very long chain fatty acids protein n=1 Tax=Orchesella dallaii TaxID=48710 RepID=A0ABP1RBZ0_9HEXA